MAWAAAVYLLYTFGGLAWLRIPWLPLSVIGIAVSFYVGFKNNAAYDRFWEGRKIWGAVVNESRSWASGVLCYVLPGDNSTEAQNTRRELVFRHLAWINALRLQLRSTSRFHDRPARGTRKRLEAHAEVMRNDWDVEMKPFLSPEAFGRVSGMVNPATHIVHDQGMQLSDLVRQQKLDLFHQIALMDILRELYTLQGKAERIKNFPLPRQYATGAHLFVFLFLQLLPFAVVPACAALGAHLEWLALPACMLLAWVFSVWDGIVDYSENPFEGLINDIPMTALSRTIEIDMRQMLGETDVPPPAKPMGAVLM